MKLKKLVLKKEVVDRLGDNQMNRIFGRGNFCPAGNPLAECSYACQPNTDINDCPDRSKEYGVTGCEAETCGWAYTCNGK
jgi:hypothetical protein